jgi:stage II sporulation protein AA (anti-sigma F factor antagonist)
VTEPSAAPFSLDVSRVDDEVELVAIGGELDFGQSKELADTLERLRREGARWFVLDLAELTFIDSSGINVLVVAARAAADGDGALIVAAARQHVQRVFEIVRLSELMPVESDVDAAIESLRWRRGLTAG